MPRAPLSQGPRPPLTHGAPGLHFPKGPRENISCCAFKCLQGVPYIPLLKWLEFSKQKVFFTEGTTRLFFYLNKFSINLFDASSFSINYFLEAGFEGMTLFL